MVRAGLTWLLLPALPDEGKEVRFSDSELASKPVNDEVVGINPAPYSFDADPQEVGNFGDRVEHREHRLGGGHARGPFCCRTASRAAASARSRTSCRSAVEASAPANAAPAHELSSDRVFS